MQFAFDLDGIMLVTYHWLQLIDASQAEARAREAFATLLDAAPGRPDLPPSTRS